MDGLVGLGEMIRLALGRFSGRAQRQVCPCLLAFCWVQLATARSLSFLEILHEWELITKREIYGIDEIYILEKMRRGNGESGEVSYGGGGERI